MGSGGDLSLRVVLQAQDLASGKLKGFGSTLINLAGAKGPLLGALLAIVGGMAAVGAASVQAAANWQTSLNQLVTGAGESQSNLAMVGNGMLQMAIDTGTSTQQLAKGMYMIESGGYHGAQGLAILKAAAEGAKVGAADLGTVADATDTVLKNFGSTGLTATQAVNTLIATVSHGKTTMQALSASLSQVLPTASSAGVSLNDTAAAMATMTGEGVPAAQAATYLRQTILGLDAPSTAAKKALAGVGLTTAQVSNEMKKSLPGALKMITDAVGKKFPVGSAGYVNALKNISGGTRTMQGMLDLTGSHMKTFQQNVQDVSGSVKQGGNSINGWSIVQGSFNQKMAQAKETIEVLGIKIGQKLLPPLTKIVGAIAPAVTWLMNLASAVTHNQTAMAIIGGVLVGFVALILMLLVPAFIAWATAAGAAALATLAATWPFILAAAIIAAVVAIIILAVQHWGQIVQWLKNVWGAISGFFVGLWNKVKAIFWAAVAVQAQILQKIQDGIHNAFNAVVGFVKAALQRLWDTFTAPFRAIGQLFQWLYNHNVYFKRLVDKIRAIVSMIVVWLKSKWQEAIQFIVRVWQNVVKEVTDIWNNITGAIQKAVNFVVGWVKGQIQSHVNDLRQKWFMLQAIVQQAWQKVQSVISGAWNNYIVKPLQNLWNNIKNFANGWPKDALNWGVNLVQGFINGITSMLGNVKNAAGNIISNVGKLLGFHSPAKEGPGMHIIEWGAGMVAGFSTGVMQAIPTLKAAVNLAVNRGIASPLSPPALSGAIPYGRPPMSNSYSSYAGGNTHNGDIIIQGAGMNARQIVDEIERRQNQKYRRSGLMGNLAAGARNS